jgi:methyl-accepting chemotaxis protein
VKISDAVLRQREGTSQVKTAVVDIVGAVNQSLVGSADNTKNAESLLQLSHDLKEAAKHFRVSSGNDASEAAHGGA